MRRRSAPKRAVTSAPSTRRGNGSLPGTASPRSSWPRSSTAPASHGLKRELFLKGEIPKDRDEREAALTKAALRYASALATGYSDPKKVNSEVYTVKRPKLDAAAGLSKALAGRQARGLVRIACAPDRRISRAVAGVRPLREAQRQPWLGRSGRTRPADRGEPGAAAVARPQPARDPHRRQHGRRLPGILARRSASRPPQRRGRPAGLGDSAARLTHLPARGASRSGGCRIRSSRTS